MTDDPKTNFADATWGPAAVYAAAGIHPGVAHSWIARHLVPLGPGPGMGRERQFSFMDAVLLATIVELTRLGLTVSTASHAAASLVRNRDWTERALADANGLWTLVLERSPAPGGVEAPGLSPIAFFRADDAEGRDAWMRKQYPADASIVRVCVSAIAERMIARLANAAPTPRGRRPAQVETSARGRGLNGLPGSP